MHAPNFGNRKSRQAAASSHFCSWHAHSSGAGRPLSRACNKDEQTGRQQAATPAHDTHEAQVQGGLVCAGPCTTPRAYLSKNGGSKPQVLLSACTGYEVQGVSPSCAPRSIMRASSGRGTLPTTYIMPSRSPSRLST
jgi:hypothetical protein